MLAEEFLDVSLRPAHRPLRARLAVDAGLVQKSVAEMLVCLNNYVEN